MVISRIPKSGMRITLMGIISMLKQEVQDIALLKPVVSDKKEYSEDNQKGKKERGSGH